jgi:hypothetical protein
MGIVVVYSTLEFVLVNNLFMETKIKQTGSEKPRFISCPFLKKDTWKLVKNFFKKLFAAM